MKDCLFCKIVEGEIPSYTIYEDDLVKVFLDVEDKFLNHAHEVAKKVYEILKDKLNIDGLTVVQNNFYGQAIKHFHIHLIPRYENDNINMVRQENKKEVENIYKELTE